MFMGPYWGMDIVEASRNLRWIPRFSTFPLIRPYSVAEHSYGVAVLALDILSELREHPSKNFPGTPPSIGEVVEYALHHDTHESVMGDILFQNKRATPDLESAVTEVENNAEKDLGIPTQVQGTKIIVGIADLAELYLYVDEEQKLGNSDLRLQSTKILSAIRVIGSANYYGLSRLRGRFISDLELYLIASAYFEIPTTLPPDKLSYTEKSVSVCHEKKVLETLRQIEMDPKIMWGLCYRTSTGGYKYKFMVVTESSFLVEDDCDLNI